MVHDSLEINSLSRWLDKLPAGLGYRELWKKRLKESAKTPEAFESEMAKFRKRHPEWFVGPVQEGKAGNVATPRPLPVPPVKTGSKPWTDERKDWAMRAANDVEMENDAQEPE